MVKKSKSTVKEVIQEDIQDTQQSSENLKEIEAVKQEIKQDILAAEAGSPATARGCRSSSGAVDKNPQSPAQLENLARARLKAAERKKQLKEERIKADNLKKLENEVKAIEYDELKKQKEVLTKQ